MGDQMSKFFFKDIPVNADIKRHREKEQEIREKISQLENDPEIESDKFKSRALITYRNFLSILLSSKADIVDKIGRKK